MSLPYRTTKLRKTTEGKKGDGCPLQNRLNWLDDAGGLAFPDTVLPPYFQESFLSCWISSSKFALGTKFFSARAAISCRLLRAAALSVIPSFAFSTAVCNTLIV